jgi:hypothetical protein
LQGLGAPVKAPEGSNPLSGVTNAPNPVLPDRGWFIVAGPKLTPSQFHCAIVGAREAVDGFAEINAAHWKAAKVGERGYRLPDAAVSEPKSRPVTAITERVASLIATIPDDLSIPPFLDRRPATLQA